MKPGIRLAILAGAVTLSFMASPVQAAPASGLEAFKVATTDTTSVEKARWYRRHHYHRYYYRPYWRHRHWHHRYWRHRHHYRPWYHHHRRWHHRHW